MYTCSDGELLQMNELFPQAVLWARVLRDWAAFPHSLSLQIAHAYDASYAFASTLLHGIA